MNNWEPLLAIADLCGFGDEARDVALNLSGQESDDQKTLGALLLGDLRELFDDEDEKQLPTSYIVTKLLEREDRPW